MTIAKEGKGASASVTWRLPLTVAADMNGNWDPMREMLDKWAESGETLEPAESEETTSVCLRISHAAYEALVKESKRLSKETGKKWSVGKVARTLWELREEESAA